MQPIASNPPIASIYRCEHGGIHLICQNVNIGLHPDEFCTLNREVQHAMSLIEDGIWSCSYLSLSWHTTVLCLSASVLPPLAEVMQEAAETIELEDIKPTPQTICHPRSPSIKVFPGSQFVLRQPVPNMDDHLN